MPLGFLIPFPFRHSIIRHSDFILVSDFVIRAYTQPMPIVRSEFGRTPDGKIGELFTLTNSNGVMLKLTNYGARVTELHVPDRKGQLANVTLGFDHFAGYLGDQPYFGTIVGRVVNRIARGTFKIAGKTYQITTNIGPNTLHGGKIGIDRALWKSTPIDREDGPGVDFSHTSPDGDQGFPGNLAVAARYTLTHDNALRVELEASTDRTTPVNLSNHAYFNLAGAGSGLIYDHVLTLHASHYTPVNEELIPTGEIRPVAGTIMDFTKPTPIGQRIHDVPGGGYDHNYVLHHVTGKPILVAKTYDPTSGRTMDVLTTQPGIQFYAGNSLDGSFTGLGGKYVKHGAFCLETQHFPDSVNHPHFPSTLLRPGETYRHTTIYKFGTAY